FTTDDLRRRLDVFVDNVLAMTRYELPALRTSVTLFIAEGAPNAAEHDLVGLASYDLVVRRVPGTHYTILRAPHVERVAREIAYTSHEERHEYSDRVA